MHLRPYVLLVGFVFLYTTPPVTTTLSLSFRYSFITLLSRVPLKTDKSLLLYYESRDIHVLFMVTVRFHYLLANKQKNAGLSSLQASLLCSLVSGGFAKCNAANLIPV